MGSRKWIVICATLVVWLVGAVAATSVLAATEPKWTAPEGQPWPQTLEGSSFAASYFEGQSGGLGQRAVECSHTYVTLVIPSAHNGHLTLELTGCHTNYPAEPVHTARQAEGTIQLYSGAVPPYYIRKEEHNAVLALPMSSTQILHGSVERYKLTGTLVIPITPVNSATTKHVIRIKETKSKQEVTTFEEQWSGVIEHAEVSMHLNTFSEVVGVQAGEITLYSGVPLDLEA